MSTQIKQPFLYDSNANEGSFNFFGGPSGNLGIILKKTSASGSCYIEINKVNNIRLLLSAGGTNYVYLENNGTTWLSFSDERLKNIIDHLSDPLPKIDSLRTIRFCYKSDICENCPPIGIDPSTNIPIYNCECIDKSIKHGLIAQDVQNIYPELVTVFDEEGHLSLALDELIPLLIAGINELNNIIIAQETEINSLIDQIDQALQRITILEQLI